VLILSFLTLLFCAYTLHITRISYTFTNNKIVLRTKRTNNFVLNLRLNCTFDLLTFKNLWFWPFNFYNSTFGLITLAFFANSCPPTDFVKVNAHVRHCPRVHWLVDMTYESLSACAIIKRTKLTCVALHAVFTFPFTKR
jgi:hypothetical protein